MVAKTQRARDIQAACTVADIAYAEAMHDAAKAIRATVAHYNAMPVRRRPAIWFVTNKHAALCERMARERVARP